jgi:hypothetical protein
MALDFSTCVLILFFSWDDGLGQQNDVTVCVLHPLPATTSICMHHHRQLSYDLGCV